jgi:tRNA A-37 threonylcarbamoyl transferase component Bud32
MIGKTLGNLRIVSELGRGGMGVVYLAEHKTLNKKFAVKSLSPSLTEDVQFRERFYQEARNQAILDHPNIVQATDFFDENQQFFFVMEYVDGQDLGEIIRTRGCLPEEEALSIFKHVLEGLNFAHSKGIIHRDVKPPNVMIAAGGRPRIMDFGIAVLFGDERLTATGTTVGSPWYMSPEQITNPQKIDHRSDVYSAGILLYEMLTGAVPFEGKSDFSVKEQQVNAPRPNPRDKNPQISVELAKIVLRAIDKDPDKRFQGCAEFLDCIKAYEASKIPQPDTPSKWLLLSLAVVAILGVGVVIYIIFFSPKPDGSKIEAQKAHESVALLLNVGSKVATILCREFYEIDEIRKQLDIASEMETSGIEEIQEIKEDFLEKIRQKELNIRDDMARYNDTIKKLGTFEKSIVNSEFKHYLKSLDSGGRSSEDMAEKQKIGRILRSHYDVYADKRIGIKRDGMREACIAR